MIILAILSYFLENKSQIFFVYDDNIIVQRKEKNKMFQLLLAIIYLAFISLGLPDSLLGSAWPMIRTEFGVPISYMGMVSMIIAGGTIVSSLFSERLTKKFSTKVVTTVSVLLTAIALFGFSISNHVVFFFLFAIPLGLGAGSIDSALNGFVSLHYKASQVSFLHCFYGLGVAVTPYLMSLALHNGNDWRKGYQMVTIIQGMIAVVTVVALPLWKKVEKKQIEEDEEETKTMSFMELIKVPAIRWAGFVFLFSCALELTSGSWSTTFFVEAKNVAPESAARVSILFYAGLTLGRLFSGILVERFGAWKLIWSSSTIILVAIIGMMLPLPIGVCSISLFLIGLGVGPLFPNLTYLTPINFGKEISLSVMGLQSAFSYVGIMTLPPLFGILADKWSTSIFPYYLLGLFLIYMYSIFMLVRRLKKQGRY